MKDKVPSSVVGARRSAQPLGRRDFGMLFFRVVLHGTGISFTLDGASRPCIGFYTSRSVRASSAEEAVHKANQLVLATWRTEEYIRANSGGLPLLTTDEVEEISFWRTLKIPNTGHTFYAEP